MKGSAKEGGVPPLVDHRGQPVRTLGELTGKPHLAVFYPGLNYGPLAPLFFYLGPGLEAAGWDVIALDYRYNENQEFLASTDEEKDRWFLADSLAFGRQLQELTAGRERVARVAKSLGTTMMYHQAREGLIPPENELVWLTPGSTASQQFELLKQLPNRSLVAYGTADPHFLKAQGSRPVDLRRVSLLEVEGAGHVFEVEGDVAASIRALGQVVEATLKFLQETP